LKAHCGSGKELVRNDACSSETPTILISKPKSRHNAELKSKERMKRSGWRVEKESVKKIEKRGRKRRGMKR